ncbi:MAG: Na+/H+ antiporter NhaA [Bdellovibrionaceae bacterium]|nr:Na+/H+ antiporter NhaA [Pseudobdellovibrionaceae bacterium]
MIKTKAKAQAKKVVRTIITPVEKFLATESAGGLVLMFTTVVAMVWANSPYYLSYEHFIHAPLGLKIADFFIEKSLQHWVNDGLMVIFFFVVGLEIKRELFLGELSSPKKAALPMFAALGGMLVPAGFYAIFNNGELGQHGWGIPMATDIAFAVGILTLFSRKVPFALKIFLLALAIVDDLGAVLVIAFFYTDEIARNALGFAAIGFGVISLLKFSGIRKFLVYIILGIVIWFAVLKSGIHATIAGVILGLLTPTNPFMDEKEALNEIDSLATDLAKDLKKSEGAGTQQLSDDTKCRLDKISTLIHDSHSPLDTWIHFLHPWVSYFIMPIFALVNAGVHIEGITIADFATNNISIGIILGLVLGKPIGVLIAAFISVKLNIAVLPKGVSWYQMAAVGFLAGIGFTMALFVSNLALNGDASLEIYSKTAILVASLIAGLIGAGMLILCKDRP